MSYERRTLVLNVRMPDVDHKIIYQTLTWSIIVSFCKLCVMLLWNCHTQWSWRVCDSPRCGRRSYQKQRFLRCVCGRGFWRRIMRGACGACSLANLSFLSRRTRAALANKVAAANEVHDKVSPNSACLLCMLRARIVKAHLHDEW